MKLHMLRTVCLFIIRTTQQWYMSYRFADSFRAGPAVCCLWTTENEFYLKRIFKLSGKNALIRMGISQSEYSVQTWETSSVFKLISFILKLICKWLSVWPFSLKVSFPLTPTCITQLSVMKNRQNCIPVVSGSINLCVKHRTHFCSS
jgi:hypothetical protein